jgi:endonuclease/exonuclease/phosphatase family metal-dependent hydrolase
MTSSETLTTFRLATINVHSFSSPKTHKNNIEDLVSILNPLNLDLIAVQEIQNNKKWEKFCELLSLPHLVYGSSEGEYFGNGIASRYPIQSNTNQRSTLFCRAGTRSLLQCRLDGDHPFIKHRIFAVTHLDPYDEDDRLKQINEFNLHTQNIDILMGDMNALTRDDYSDKYFKDIILEKREKSEWEKPRFDLTKLITDEWNYQDVLKSINPQLKDEQIATCDYGTRIDYIYVRPCEDDPWILSECSIIDTKEVTDHNVVLAEFKLKSK